MPEHFTKTDSKNSPAYIKILVGIVIALQVCFLLFAGAQKQEFHIDEIYSYAIANSPNAQRFSYATWLQDVWISGSEFDDITTVADGDQFNFAAAYSNTSIDAHPPLYYWALHAICALTPNTFTKWSGLALNIICFVITQVFLYLIGCRALKSKTLCVALLVLYGFSAWGFGTVLYIRMYALLTMFAAIFTYLTLKLEQEGPHTSTILLSALVLYLGAMTQYYFLIFAFFAILIQVIRFIGKHEIKGMLAYGFSSVAAVALMLISFPYAIGQATGTDTNNVGNEVSRALFDFGLWKTQILSLGKEILTNLSYSLTADKVELCLLFVALVACIVVAVAKKRTTNQLENLDEAEHLGPYPFVWLALTCFFTFLAITKIGGDYVYLRYIYFVIPLGLVCLFMIFDHLIGAISKATVAVCALCIVAAIANMGVVVVRGDDSYTYGVEAADTQAVAAYNDTPLIFLLKDGPTALLTSNYTKIRTFDSVYAGDGDAIIANNLIGAALAENGSCVLFIPMQGYWVNGYNPEEVLSNLVASNPGITWTQITASGFLGNYYLLNSAA